MIVPRPVTENRADRYFFDSLRPCQIANRALAPGSCFLLIAFVALDDSVTLDPDLGVQLGSLVIGHAFPERLYPSF